MSGHASMVVTRKRPSDDGGKEGDQPPSNDNAPFDAKEWRRTYMREYMRALRARKRRERELEK